MCSFIYGQTSEDTLRTKEDIIIIKGYKPSVSDAYKIGSNPSIEDSVIPAPKIKYSTIKKQIETPFNIDPIKPARMKGVPLTKLSKGYVKGGIGNFTNTLLEAYVNNSRSRKHSVGVYAKHLASQGGINDVGYNGFSGNEMEVFGKKFLKKHLISGAVNYDRDVLHYYGYDPEESTFFNEENTKQWFSKAGASVQLKSFFRDSSKTNYDVGLSYYNLFDKVFRTENYGRVDVKVKKYFNPEWSDFVNNEVLTLNGYIDYNNFSFLTSKGNSLVKLNPQIVSRGEKWKLDVGLSMFMETLDNTASFHFYPNAHVKYNVFREMLIPYAGLSGGIDRNNYASLALENPFIDYYGNALNTKTRYDIYGGVRGAFSSKLAFNLKGSKKRVMNMPFYVNRYSIGAELETTTGDYSFYRWGGKEFSVLFDTVSVTTLDGQLSYLMTDKINAILKGEYFIYSTDNLPEPWHRPDWKITATGNYYLKDKFILSADIFAISGQTALIYEDNGAYIGTDEFGIEMFKKELAGTVDINLGIEYRYTKKLSAFINFNNIAGINYNRWNNYPTQGFNVLGGIKYSFWEK